MTTMSLLIIITLATVAYSLWVRRHTWASRWEIGASLTIFLEGCALLLMSPHTSPALGPTLYRAVGVWNLQHLLGHVCVLVAIAAVIHHVLVRLADDNQARALFRKHVVLPLRSGIGVAVVAFVIADEEYHSDSFSAHVSDVWLGMYWLVVGGLVVYLSIYAGRLLLILRADPRGRATADIYLVSASFGTVASLIQVGTALAGIDIALPVWLCVCLAIGIFAYGSARSWRAKVAWFTPSPPAQPVSPRHPA